MFNFKKPPQAPAPNLPLSAASPWRPETREEIYVMPEKFHPHQVKSANKPLIITLMILILVAMASATYFLYDLWQKNQSRILANANQNINQPLNTNLNGNVNNANIANENTNQVDANANENINSELDEEGGVAEGAGEEAGTDATHSTPPIFSSDSDHDGLTDLEEGLLTSSPAKPDTDGDGYTDGQEVINGYNPVKAGSSALDKLAAADFMSILAADFLENNFQVLYLKDWSVNVLAAIQEARLTAPTGEIIKISVENNPNALSATDRYLAENPEALLSQLRTIQVGDLSGIYTLDGLRVYLTDEAKTKFYIFDYVMEPGAEFRYPAIFTAIIKSFKLVATPVLPPQGANNNTSTNTSTNFWFYNVETRSM